MAEEHKGVALIILGIVAVLAIVGLVLLFSRAGATGKAFAAQPFEGDVFATQERIGDTAANVAKFVCIPSTEGKVQGEFQRAQLVYDDRERDWLESKGFTCEDV